MLDNLRGRKALAYIFPSLIACGYVPANAQTVEPQALSGRIQISKADAPIEAGGSDLPLTEPYTAVDPTNPDHVVVGSIVAPTTEDSPWRCAAFTSFDGGSSWSRHDFDMERCIDPWINYMSDGTVLFTGIEIQDGYEEAWRFRMVQYRSVDGRWTDDPVSLGRTHDHGMLAVDRRTGAIFLTSQRTSHVGANPHVYIGRSDDGGLTWTDLHAAGADTMISKPTGLAVLPDGSLFISYQENIPEWDSVETVYIRGIRSEDGGETFTEPVLISDGCDVGHSGFPGYPFLDADMSEGDFDGRLYHACILPDLGGVGIAHSATGGQSWSGLLRADSPPSSGGAYVRTPMLAVNNKGVVGVAWYDRRNDPDRQCQDVYFTASLDGGETFLPNERVSTMTSCPNSPGNRRAAESWPMGGDYSSLAAGPDGTFHLVWADSRSGRFQLHHAAISVNAE